MNEKEIRYLPMEVRAEETEDRGAVISGYPIVFEQEIDMGDWREVIDAGSMGDGSVLNITGGIAGGMTQTVTWGANTIQFIGGLAVEPEGE